MTQMPVLAIRPEPGLSKTIAAGKEAGLKIEGYPLSSVQPVAWNVPERADFDALLVGSANVFRHGGDGLDTLQELPVLAVGETTAKAAHDGGFNVQAVGEGGLQSLIDALDETSAHWLRLAGEEHVPLAIPPNLKLTTRVVYRVEVADVPERMLKSLKQDCVVLLHSAAAAQHFEQQCTRHDIDTSKITLAALGPRIVEGLKAGWKSVHWAETPREEGLLALAKRLSGTI